MAESKDYRQILTDRLIEQLEAGTAPWQKPWDAKAGIRRLPYNPTSGKDYRGANSLMLSMYGRSDPRWCTYKQADAQGWQVRKGEKGAQVEYWKFHDEKQAVDEKGKPRFNEDGTPVMVSYQLERPQVFRAVVFNAEQMDNVPELAKGPRLYEWDPMERAEQILQSSQAAIFHDQNDRAYYTPARDEIHMPGRDQFATPQAYYSTAMHELGHWTGHESRLGRDLTGGFGSSDYAKEELRAELASYFLADKLGIPHEAGGLDQHASYVKSWIKALKDDKNEIFRASRDAEQITEYVLQLDRERSKEVGLERGDAARELAIENTAITEGLRAVAAGQSRDGLDAATEKAFGNVLPASWNGNMQIVGVVEVEIGGKTHVEWAVNMPEGTQPQFYGVYAQLEGGMHAWIADRPDLAQANRLAHRLTSIHETALPDPERKPGVAVIVPPEPEKELAKERTELVVPYREKEAAKALGAKWDKEAKAWYAPEGTDLKPLAQWMPAKEQSKAPELPAQPKAAHELTFAEFAKDVRAEKLVMHGRDWQVIHAGKDLGFADGDTAQEAVARAHEREVNNALWGNSQDAPWASDPDHTAMGQKPTMPPAHVLAEYPHLVEKFAEVVKSTPALTQEQAAPNLDAPTPAAGEKTYLAVPFKEKNQARDAGAKWDKEAKSWYAEPGADLTPLAKWVPGQEQAPAQQIAPAVSTPAVAEATAPGKVVEPAQEKNYLAVPFKEKEQARAAGAKWDKEAKAWYAAPGADMTALQKWVPSKDMGQGPSLNPEEEFAKAIRAAGLDLVDKSGNPTMPIMDGKLQRIPVAGGKKGNRDGAYVGYLDGRPAGFIQNFSSGEEVKWKLDGPEMSPADRARLAAEAAVKKEQRAQELGVQHEEAAGKALARWDRAAEMKPGETTPYLDRKQVEPLGVRRSGNDMLVPVRDIDGKLWAVQTVFPEKRELEPGTDPLDKVFTKGAMKDGNFHLIGEVRPGEPIITLEGYATGASVHMATGYTVAVAFDSGNLDAVVGALKERYPTNPHFIGADDDRFAKPGRVHKNAGLNKAIDAANKHGVGVIVPTFAEGSRGTDFNDMHVEQGLGAVTAAVDQAISRTMEQSRQQAVELAQQRVGQGAAVTSPGANTRHTGEVVGVDGYHATQVAGKAAVVHQVKDLDKLPSAGQTATIQYSEGKGKVSSRNVEKERQTQLER